MSADDVKPRYDAKRRIQFLFGAVLLLILAASGAWFFIADRIQTVSGDIIAQNAQAGIEIDCDGREVRGFPFRFGLFCQRTGFTDVAQGVAFNAGALRSAAQFYAPRDLIVELDGPASLDRTGFESLNMKWSQMGMRVKATEPIPQNVSIFGRDMVLELGEAGPELNAAEMQGFMRLVGSDIDLAGRAVAFDFVNISEQLDGLPPLGGDFDIRLVDGAGMLQSDQPSLRGMDINLTRFALLLTDDRGLIVSGPLNVSEAGLLNGELNVRVIDVDAVKETLANALPDAAALITAFADGRPRLGERGDEIEFQITLKDGQARIGLIPIGNIQPFG